VINCPFAGLRRSLIQIPMKTRNPSNMKNRFAILAFPCLLLTMQSPGQTPAAAGNASAAAFEQERVHVHFDKDTYLPGETIWMKAYILAGSRPSNRSKNIYFDLTDGSGNLIAHNVSPVKDGTANSSFFIPASMTDAALHVKVYTQWMLNFDSSFLYNKDIPVLAAWDGQAKEPERHVASIRFFPEGGDMVGGLNSVIAFEVSDQRGRPVSMRGMIQSNSEPFVDSIATVHDGMGIFSLRPKAGEQYTAIWKDEYGQTHTTDLPEPAHSGAVLRLLEIRDDAVRMQVERLADAPDIATRLGAKFTSKSILRSTPISSRRHPA